MIRASIDQRIFKLRPVPFNSAIDFKKNKKYLKFAIPPLAILLGFLLAAPGVITEPTNRIIKHNEYFEKEAPFHFVLLTDNLIAIQQEDFEVEVSIEGDNVPLNVFINTEFGSLRMRKKSIATFNYVFKNIQKKVNNLHLRLMELNPKHMQFRFYQNQSFLISIPKLIIRHIQDVKMKHLTIPEIL